MLHSGAHMNDEVHKRDCGWRPRLGPARCRGAQRRWGSDSLMGGPRQIFAVQRQRIPAGALRTSGSALRAQLSVTASPARIVPLDVTTA